MVVTEIVKDIWSVGVVDWDSRTFHGPSYSTHRGTSYNAYVIKDDKTVLVDAVEAAFGHELLANIHQVYSGDLDYVVVNHIEPDHSGALPQVMELHPQATIICTAKAKDGLLNYFPGMDWNFMVVKSGDSVELGQHSLHFIETPMMHWPDNMITYIPQKKLLLSNDAFGQHFAWSQPFDDQNDLSIVMIEATKYYANILNPFNKIVARKLEEIGQMGLDIEIIAPSHGIIWRTHPTTILEAYSRWSSAQAQDRVIVVYETMWGSTEKLARAIVDGISAQGIPVKLFKASVTDHNDIIAELLEAKAIIVGSSTINNDMLNPVIALLEELKGLKPTKKLGAAFGSHGWRGGAVAGIEKALTQAGVDLVAESLPVQGVPDAEFLARCRRWGQELAGKLT